MEAFCEKRIVPPRHSDYKLRPSYHLVILVIKIPVFPAYLYEMPAR